MRALSIGFMLAAAAAAAQQDAADKAAFEKVCGGCHASSLASDLKTQEDWAETVESMISFGAKGTDEQFERVLRYLARNLTRVNVNTGEAWQIAPVLDVSESTAQAVVAYRSQHGPFKTLEDLAKVPGVTAVQLQARKERIAF